MDIKAFKLDKAFFLLNKGKILHVNAKHGGGEIWLYNGYFQYRYFGSSAIKATENDLKWLFETIFETDDYVVFSDWDDIQLSYICHDERALWLFTDGEYDEYDTRVI